MKFWKQTSIPPTTTNAISGEAYKTTTALLASSEYVSTILYVQVRRKIL